jgi:hypothetical protein
VEATWVYYILAAFLVVFGATVIYSTSQEGRAGKKEVESIKQTTISNTIIPTVLDIFEYEPLSYSEEESLLKDRLASKLEEGLSVIARAMKRQELVKQSGRFMVRCGAIGIFLEIIFIFLVACLGAGIVLTTVAFGTSFLLFTLCALFWEIRRRNLDALQDLAEVE